MLSTRYINALTLSLTYQTKLNHLRRLKWLLLQYFDSARQHEISCPLTRENGLRAEELGARIADNIAIIDRRIEICQEMTSLGTRGFDENDYYQRYPDVRQAEIRALYHYAAFGRIEGRTFKTRDL